MRPLALALASVPALVSLGVGLLVLAWLSVPFENSDPSSRDETLWVALFLGGCAAGVVFAAICAASIAAQRLRLALAALVCHGAAATALLVAALDVSHHSDGAILAVYAIAETCGVLALVVGSRELRGPG